MLSSEPRLGPTRAACHAYDIFEVPQVLGTQAVMIACPSLVTREFVLVLCGLVHTRGQSATLGYVRFPMHRLVLGTAAHVRASAHRCQSKCDAEADPAAREMPVADAVVW